MSKMQKHHESQQYGSFLPTHDGVKLEDSGGTGGGIQIGTTADDEDDALLLLLKKSSRDDRTSKSLLSSLLLPLSGFVVATIFLIVCSATGLRVITNRTGGIQRTEAVPSLPMLGKSHHHPSDAKDRILDDCGYVDVPGVSCEDAFNAPFFRDYIEFQHKIAGVDDISLVEDGEKGQIYTLEFAGTYVSLFVSYEEDDPLTADIELVDGFDFFDAYHEHWDFQTLSTTTNDDNGITKTKSKCRNVRKKQRTPLNMMGCRITHSFIAIFSEQVPVTRDEWFAAADAEAVGLFDMLTQKTGESSED